MFTNNEIGNFVTSSGLVSPYWLVRKVVIILTFFGGLCHTELMDLKLEGTTFNREGIIISHSRAKQRSDKRDTKYLVPRATAKCNIDFTAIVEQYVTMVREELEKSPGRVLWNGRPDSLVNSPLGKNMIAKVIMLHHKFYSN